MVDYYETEDGRPTCKQYAELNYASIAIGDILCRQCCNMIRGYILLVGIEKARAAGDNNCALEQEELYHELIRKDMRVQEQFFDLLTGFATMQPCYTRTSLMGKEIVALLSGTKDNIAKLKAFLMSKKTRTLNQPNEMSK